VAHEVLSDCNLGIYIVVCVLSVLIKPDSVVKATRL
jgi:hypothetical protein